MGDEPLLGGCVVGQVETGADFALVRTEPYAVGIAAIAECHAQGVNDEGFSRAGFTGYRSHAGSELNFQGVYESELLNAECGEQGGGETSRLKKCAVIPNWVTILQSVA